MDPYGNFLNRIRWTRNGCDRRVCKRENRDFWLGRGWTRKLTPMNLVCNTIRIRRGVHWWRKKWIWRDWNDGRPQKVNRQLTLDTFDLFCFSRFSRDFLIHKYVNFGMSLWQLFETNPMRSVSLWLKGIQQRYTGFLSHLTLGSKIDPGKLDMYWG